MEREKMNEKGWEGEEGEYVPVSKDALTRSLLTMDEVKRLGKKSDWKGLLQLGYHGGLLTLTTITLWRAIERASGKDQWDLPDTLCLSLATLLHSFILSFLFMPLHECVHQTAFRTPFLNVSLAFVCGFLTFRPPVHYKYYHMAHHRFTGDKKRDPELSGSLLDLAITSVPMYLLYLSSIPFWIDRFGTLLSHAILGAKESYLTTKRAEYLVTRESRMFLALYLALSLVSLSLSLSAPLTLWLLPTFSAQPFLRFYLLAEHTGCLAQADMRVNTRTTMTSWWYRKLAWEMPFHSQHHTWPSAPFHSLSTLYEKVKEKERERAGGGEDGCLPSGHGGYWSIHQGVVLSLLRSHPK
jgi:fatty acid desaturase